MTTNTFYDSFCRLSESAMKSLIFTLTALTFISASPVYAEDRFGVLRCGPAAEKTDEAGVLEKVERNYGTLSTLAARFLQESYFFGSDDRQQSAGLVSFERPGKMDWLYGAPDEQRFTSDGKTIWWYQPQQNQVVIRTIAQSFTSDVPVSFLLGVGKLRENFKFAAKCANDAGLLLRLAPLKTSSSLETFYLLVSPKDFSPLGARIADANGNETSILFEDRTLNGPVDAKRFYFDIPKGTDIIDEREKPARESEVG